MQLAPTRITTHRPVAAAAVAHPLEPLLANVLTLARTQLNRSLAELHPDQFPRTTGPDGKWQTTPSHGWTSGFFPGELWYAFEQTHDPHWRRVAEKWTHGLEAEKNDGRDHDIGFRMMTSFGQQFRLTGDPHAKQVLLTAAKTLATRFDPRVGCIRSWPGHHYPVIMDNMMNLELLFWAARHGGSPKLKQIAISHALKTMQNHFRPDGSSFHLVDYDPHTGKVLERTTVQGFKDPVDGHVGTWARGQAWAIWGFSMTYGETHDARFLATAKKAADFYLAHLPADKVPNWDFDPHAPSQKDSSAAAVAASGLLALARQVPMPDRARYHDAAVAMLRSLASPPYLADPAKGRSLLLHGTGNLPGHSEVDAPLIYGDYYFLQALRRLQAWG